MAPPGPSSLGSTGMLYGSTAAAASGAGGVQSAAMPLQAQGLTMQMPTQQQQQQQATMYQMQQQMMAQNTSTAGTQQQVRMGA